MSTGRTNGAAPDLGRAALAYATHLGWPVLPCEPGGKAPLGALVPHGLRDATTDPETIRRWWQERPDANPGVLPPPGVLVLDCDEPRLATELLGEYPALRRAPRQQTPRGGCHIVVSVPEDLHLPTRAGALPALDLRGLGRAYIVAAPSRTERGAYRWIVRPRPGEAPPACPPALLERLGAARRRPERTTPAAGSEDEAIPAGRRNATLAAHAGALRRQGLGAEAIEDALLAINARACRPPLGEEEVRRIAASVARYEPETPAARIVAEVVKNLPRPDDVAAVLPPDTPPEAPRTPPAGSWTPDWEPMPLEALPDAVAAYVRAAAAAIPVEPAMVAAHVPAVLAAAVGTTHRLGIKRSWVEPATLWSCVVAPSGSNKSAGWEAAVRPVLDLANEANGRFEEEARRYQEDLGAWEGLPESRRRETPRPAEPVHRRYRIDRGTIEAVLDLHPQNPRGLLLAVEELAGWVRAFDRYARQGGGDLQAWISLYENRPVTVDRKTDGCRHIARPSVSVTGTIQPGVLRRVLRGEHLDAGFTARLLLVEPPVWPRTFTDADVTREVAEAYHRLVRRLYALPPREEPLPLTREARATFAAWVNDNGGVMDALEDGPLRSALAKNEARAARLALILQLCDDVEHGRTPSVVTEEAMDRAAALAGWMRRETMRLYARLGLDRGREAAALRADPRLRVLETLPETFETRQYQEAAGVPERTARHQLARLIEMGHVESTGRGTWRRLEGAASL